MIEKPVKLTVQVTKGDRRAFKLACVKLGTSMSDVLRKAIGDTIDEAQGEQGGEEEEKQ